MNWLMSLFVVFLFVVFTPGVLFVVPRGGKKNTVALTHAVIFALVYHFTHKFVWDMTRNYEGFASATCNKYSYRGPLISCPSGQQCTQDPGTFKGTCNPIPCGGTTNGACTSQQEKCMNVDGSYKCIGPCDNNHTNGYCSGTQKCKKVNNIYKCAA